LFPIDSAQHDIAKQALANEDISDIDLDRIVDAIWLHPFTQELNNPSHILLDFVDGDEGSLTPQQEEALLQIITEFSDVYYYHTRRIEILTGLLGEGALPRIFMDVQALQEIEEICLARLEAAGVGFDAEVNAIEL